MTDAFETRSFEVRALNDEERTVEGIAVPYGQTVDIGGAFKERFAKGSVSDSVGKPLFWQHGEPIGVITASRDEADGHHITARISRTARGDEAYQLLKDGVVNHMSISFSPDTSTDVVDRANNLVTRKKVTTREVSLVNFPAYPGAKVSAVRSEETTDAAPAAERGGEMSDIETPNTASVVDAEARASLEDLERRFNVLSQSQTPAAPQVQYRNAAALLKDIVAGKDEAAEVYNRAATEYDDNPEVYGATVFKDLTRIFDNTSGVLVNSFGSGALPDKGNTLEFVKEIPATNTVAVAKQSAEGANLTGPGNVTLATGTATVSTYGGYFTLTRQVIERSTLPVLQRHLEAQAVAAAKDAKTEFRSAYDTAVAAQVTANNTLALGVKLTASTIFDWANLVLEGFIQYEVSMGTAPTGLLVNKNVFKYLQGLKDSTGRPILGRDIPGDGDVNTMGSFSLQNLSADINGIKVILDPESPNNGTGIAVGKATFFNSDAITSYQSSLVNLSLDNIVALTRDYSVYRYGAIAVEKAHHLTPVVFVTE